MHKINCLLIIVALFVFETVAQFRIVGLLNIDGSKDDATNLTSLHETNAQGRGFSVADNNNSLKKPSNRRKNIIKVRIIDDAELKSNINPDADDIFMVESGTQTHRHLTNDVAHEAVKGSVKTTKNETKLYQTKRPLLQRNLIQLDANQHRTNNMPDKTNRLVVFNNFVDMKFHKNAKYRNRYKSRCRCERIANCPQIQITVSRCEPDYFLCCF